MLGAEARINGHPPGNCLVLDVRTTGISANDEILCITGLDGFGRPVIKQYFRPERHFNWDDSESSNGITLQMVMNAPFFSSCRDSLRKYFGQYECIVGYGIPVMREILSVSGLISGSGCDFVDVGDIYADVVGEGYRAPLSSAAVHYGFRVRGDGFDRPSMILYVLEWLMFETRENTPETGCLRKFLTDSTSRV